MAMEAFTLLGSLALEGSKKVEAKLEEVEKQAEDTDSKFGKLTSGLASFGKTAGKVAAGGIAAFGAGLAAITTKAGNYADTILDTQAATGMATDEIQEYRAQARMAGVNTEALVNAQRRLIRELSRGEDGSARMRRALDGLNLTIEELQQASPAEALQIMLQTLRDLDDEQKRVQVGMELFNRKWMDLAPLVATSSEELEEWNQYARDVGFIVGGESLDKLNQFRMAMVKIRTALLGMSRTVAQKVAPVVEPWLEGVANWLKKNKSTIDDFTDTALVKVEEWGNWLVENGDVIVTRLQETGSATLKIVNAINSIDTTQLEAFFGYLLGPLYQGELKNPDELITLKDIISDTGDESEETKEKMSDLDKASLSLKNTLSDLEAEYDLSESQISTVESELKGFANTMVGTNLVFDSHQEKQKALRNAVDKLGIKINRQQPIWKRLNNLRQDNTNKTEENAKAQNKLTERIKEQNLAQGDINDNIEEGSEKFGDLASQMSGLYDLGEIDADRYLAFLQNQIDQVDKYSEKWIQLKGQIQSVTGDIKQEQREAIKGIFDELPKFEGALEPYKIEWEGFTDSIKSDLSSTLTDMLTEWENWGDKIGGFFDNLTRKIISKYTDKWADMIVDALSSGGKKGGWIGDVIQIGISAFSSAQEGLKVEGEQLVKMGDNQSGEEIAMPLDDNVLRDFAGKITDQMGEGGGAGISGDINIMQVEGMSDRAFVNGVQKNKDAVIGQIMQAVGNNEGLRQQLRRALA